MAEITAALVRELREKTGAGMMDCKKALIETNGNLEEATDWLRTKGLAAAAKKAGRIAAEGLVGVATSGNVGAIVEINAETDFVARNDKFQNFVSQATTVALEGKHNVDSLKAAPVGEHENLETGLTHLIAVIGENMNLRRVAHLSVTKGIVSSYMHSAIAPNLGKIGVLVALESSGDAEKLAELGKKISMHIAASAPVALEIADVDPALLEREKNILIEQARASGRPEEIILKMVDGRISKFYEEIVLLEQSFVMDSKLKILQVVENTAKEIGAPIKIAGFVRYALGEGIEKEEADFAAEVQAQAGTSR